MAEIENLTHRMLAALTDKVDRLIEGDREAKRRLSGIDYQYATVMQRLDHVLERLERIERRLDLEAASDGRR